MAMSLVTVSTEVLPDSDVPSKRRFFRLLAGVFVSASGGSLVEFALIAPVMMLMITGMFSLSLAMNSYTVLTNDVSAGARTLALSRGQTSPALAASDPCAYAIQAANNAAPSLNKSSITYSITWIPLTGTGGSYATSCPGLAMTAGDTIQLKAVYPVPLVVYGWRPITLNMSAQTSELVQ